MAYTLNGANHYFDSTAPVTALPLTLACWFRTAVLPSSNFQMLVQINNNAQASSTSSTYRLMLPANNTILRASHAANNVSGNSDSASGSVAANTWTHAAGTFRSNSRRTVFVNGSSGSSNSTSIGATSVATMNIGAVVFNTTTRNTFLNGSIAEVGVWNVELSADEILALSRGVTCDQVRPGSLVFYAPLIRSIHDVARGREITLVNTSNLVDEASPSDHPRVYA